MQSALLATHPLEFLRNVINSEGIKNIVDILRVNYFWCIAEYIPSRWLTALTCMWMSASNARPPARMPSACQTTIKQRNINHFFVIYSMYPSSNPFEPIAGYVLLFFSLYLSARTRSVAAPASSIPHEIRRMFEFRFYFSPKFIYLFMIEYKRFVCRQIRKRRRTCSISAVCLSVYWSEVYCAQRPRPTVVHLWWVWARSCQPNRSVGLYKTARIYKWLPKCFRAPPFVVCRLFNVRKWTEQNKYA